MNVNKVRFLIKLLDKIEVIHSETFASIYLDNESDNINGYIKGLANELRKMLNEDEEC